MTNAADMHSQGTTLRRIHRWSFAVLLATLLLLFAGGQVTSTDSGDAVDSWPLPLRVEMPAFTGGVLWELGHRQVAGFTGLLTGIFAFLVWRAARRGQGPEAWVRRLAYFAFVLVLAQAALGGVRVLVGMQYPALASTPEEPFIIRAIAMTHALVAQSFLVVVTTLFVATKPEWTAAPTRDIPALRGAAKAALAALILQIAFGAWLRHTMSGLGIVLHGLGALIALLFLARLVGQVHQLSAATDASLRKPANWIGFTLTAQFLLGMTSFFLVEDLAGRGPTFNFRAAIPSLHLVGGGLLVMLTQMILVRSWRGEPAADAATEAPPVLEQAHA
jgi:heme A synthase